VTQFLTRDQIVQFRRTRTTTVAVPEWGGDVMVRPLTAGEVQGMADVFSAGDRDLATNIEAAFRLVAAATINESGGPLFSGPDDLRGLEVGPIIRLATAIADASGITGGTDAGK